MSDAVCERHLNEFAEMMERAGYVLDEAELARLLAVANGVDADRTQTEEEPR